MCTCSPSYSHLRQEGLFKPRSPGYSEPNSKIPSSKTQARNYLAPLCFQHICEVAESGFPTGAGALLFTCSLFSELRFATLTAQWAGCRVILLGHFSCLVSGQWPRENPPQSSGDLPILRPGNPRLGSVGPLYSCSLREGSQPVNARCLKSLIAYVLSFHLCYPGL